MTFKEFSNDNNAPNPREALIAKLLTHNIVVEMHLTESLPRMLKENGAPKAVTDAVGTFVEPLVNLIQENEKAVIGALRAVPTAELLAEGLDAMTARMEKFVEAFAAVANTPEQMKLVGEMREFIVMSDSRDAAREIELER